MFTDSITCELYFLGLDRNLKDQESGWTALHRALFYGNIAEARLLIDVSVVSACIFSRSYHKLVYGFKMSGLALWPILNIYFLCLKFFPMFGENILHVVFTV